MAISRMMSAALAGAAVFVAQPAAAATFLFDFDGVPGVSDGSFVLDDAATPSAVTSNSVRFDNIRIKEGNVVRTDSISLLTAQAGGGLQIGTSAWYRLTGPQLFTGALRDPVFFKTTANIGWGSTGIAIGTLRVSQLSPAVTAVPEPASWALMLLGFALVGWSLRRRPRAATVRFAVHGDPRAA